MNAFISIRNQYCPNESCEFYSRRLAGNVVAHSRKHMRFRCKLCRKTWVGYRNDVRFGLRTDFEKVKSAMEMAQQGKSVRVVAQQVSVSPSTVQRWKMRLADFSVREQEFLFV